MHHIRAVDELGGHATGATGGDRLSCREVVPGEALVGADRDPGVLDRALGEDPPGRGIGMGDSEGCVEPLSRRATGAAERRRDEDVEQPLVEHAGKRRGAKVRSGVGRCGVGANHVEQLCRREGRAVGGGGRRSVSRDVIAGQVRGHGMGL
jgi:hypothetical protein